MTPYQESLCSRRALMISPLLEMHNSDRFHLWLEILAMAVIGSVYSVTHCTALGASFSAAETDRAQLEQLSAVAT
jgi:hypothetical protein